MTPLVFLLAVLVLGFFAWVKVSLYKAHYKHQSFMRSFQEPPEKPKTCACCGEVLEDPAAPICEACKEAEEAEINYMLQIEEAERAEYYGARNA